MVVVVVVVVVIFEGLGKGCRSTDNVNVFSCDIQHS